MRQMNQMPYIIGAVIRSALSPKTTVPRVSYTTGLLPATGNFMPLAGSKDTVSL